MGTRLITVNSPMGRPKASITLLRPTTRLDPNSSRHRNNINKAVITCLSSKPNSNTTTRTCSPRPRELINNNSNTKVVALVRLLVRLVFLILC